MTRTTSNSLQDRPMSIDEIVQAAGEQQVEARYSMVSYFRSASLLVKQARIYEHEGNDQMAYLLLYRYANLILGELGKHPHAKDPEHRQAWVDARKEVNKSLAKLEVLKPRIVNAYQKYQERQKAKSDRIAARSRADDQAPGRLDDRMRRVSLDSPSRDESPRRLDALQDRGEAVALANRVIRRRSYRPRADDENSQDVSTGLINARRQMSSASSGQSPPPRTSSRGQSVSKYYHYPAVADKNKSQSSGELALPTFTSIRHQPPKSPPQRPPKELQPCPTASAPLKPLKSPIVSSNLPPLPSKPTLPALPPKAAQQFRTTSTLESGGPLRTLFLPNTLQSSFLALASRNTANNLETCGILIGTLLRNAFFITHLLLPAQDSTSDTCEMRDETQLYNFIEEHEASAGREGEGESAGDQLMVLGWIHTHPSQTCFLSSADLHTHLGYQLSLSESIAIVCSPSQPAPADFGVFRLTEPPGLGVIKACERRGLFHPHEVPRGGGLFTDALRDVGDVGGAGGGHWGHVVLGEGLEFEVVDLRD